MRSRDETQALRRWAGGEEHGPKELRRGSQGTKLQTLRLWSEAKTQEGEDCKD